MLADEDDMNPMTGWQMVAVAACVLVAFAVMFCFAICRAMKHETDWYGDAYDYRKADPDD